MPTDENVNKLIINYLTLEQYQGIAPNEGELYFVDNEVDALPGQSASDAGKALTAVGDGTVRWSDFPSLADPHEWASAQTFASVVTDEIKTKAGNYVARSIAEGDGYRTLLGSTARPTTIMGSGDRPNYAKAGDTNKQKELALVSDLPAVKYPKSVLIKLDDGAGALLAASLQGEATHDVEITDGDTLKEAFGGAVLSCSGAYLSEATPTGAPMFVDTGAGEISYLYFATREIIKLSLDSFPGVEIKEEKGN